MIQKLSYGTKRYPNMFPTPMGHILDHISDPAAVAASCHREFEFFKFWLKSNQKQPKIGHFGGFFCYFAIFYQNLT